MKNLILEDYRCPDYESGLYKGIPMEYRNHPKVQELMRTRLFTVRYRGNSKVGYDRPKDFVHKDKADTFPSTRIQTMKSLRLVTMLLE